MHLAVVDFNTEESNEWSGSELINDIRTLVPLLTSFWSLLASSSESNVMNPYPLDIPPLSTTILTCFTMPYWEKSSHSSSSVVVEVMPPTKTLLGTTVPYLGALLFTAAW